MTDDSSRPPILATSSSSPSHGKIPHWMFLLIVVGIVGLMAWRHFNQPVAHHADQPIPSAAAKSSVPADSDSPSAPEDSSAATRPSQPKTNRDANSTTSGTDPSSSNSKPSPSATPTTTKSANNGAPSKSKSATEAMVPANPKPDPATKAEKPASAKPRPDNSSPDKTSRTPDPSKRMIVQGVTIKDLDGKVAYRGDVDLTDTLERIAKNKRLRFSNDGSVFQNRERRLPTKPAGYYHEYVHETPQLEGPGPQRIVTGQNGEIYYTHDHYRTFKKLR